MLLRKNMLPRAWGQVKELKRNLPKVEGVDFFLEGEGWWEWKRVVICLLKQHLKCFEWIAVILFPDSSPVALCQELGSRILQALMFLLAEHEGFIWLLSTWFIYSQVLLTKLVSSVWTNYRNVHTIQLSFFVSMSAI